MKTFNILVVGCGSIGQRHARLLSARKDVKLYIADTVEENRKYCQEKFSVAEAFEDYLEALKKGMDGVFICVPTDLHVPFAKQALDSGACVLIEKPVGLSAAEAEVLIDYPNADKRIQIGYMNRYNAQLQKIKQLIDSGSLGNILYANASVYTYGTLLFAKTPFREHEKWALIRDYTHEIDFLLYLLGPAEEVAAMGATLGDLDHLPSPNVVEIISRFCSGAIGSIHMDYARYPDKRTMEIIGDIGSIEFSINEGLIRYYHRDKKGFREEREPFIRDDMFSDQIETIIGMIKKEVNPMVSLADGIAALRFCEAAITSSVEKKYVTIKRGVE